MTTPNEPGGHHRAEPLTDQQPDATTSPADVVGPDGSRPLARALLSAEQVSAVDGPARALDGLLRDTIPDSALTFLRGRWLGHPLHPILVTVPIGAWMAVPLLDATGQRAAAQRLVAFGIAAALPATVTGLVEYTTLDEPQRRVAIFHMAANTVGLGCFARSWRTRHRGHGARGAAWSLAGLAVAGVAGALGGHLSYAQSAGVLRER